MAAASSILLPNIDIFEYGKFLLSIAECILFAYIFARERNHQRDQLLKLSTLDALTSTGNRRAFDAHLENLVRSEERNPSHTSMMLIDLDNFKGINDSHGHGVGDSVLVNIAAILSARLRASDKLYRYGGDEFVILAATDLIAATHLAEELRHLTDVSRAIHKTLPTLSIGVTGHLAEESGSDWLHRTDEALFEAKRAGRNQVSQGKLWIRDSPAILQYAWPHGQTQQPSVAIGPPLA